MNAIIRKTSMALVAFVLSFGSSMTFADDKDAASIDPSVYQKACNDGWAKGSKGPMGPDAKKFGEDFCSCYTGKYVNLLKSKGSAKPSTEEENKMSDSCVYRTMLTKVADKLKGSKNVDAAAVEDSCKQVDLNIAAQLGDTSGNSPATIKFCKCVSSDLATAMTTTLTDEEFGNKIDTIVSNCVTQ